MCERGRGGDRVCVRGSERVCERGSLKYLGRCAVGSTTAALNQLIHTNITSVNQLIGLTSPNSDG